MPRPPCLLLAPGQNIFLPWKQSNMLGPRALNRFPSGTTMPARKSWERYIFFLLYSFFLQQADFPIQNFCCIYQDDGWMVSILGVLLAHFSRQRSRPFWLPHPSSTLGRRLWHVRQIEIKTKQNKEQDENLFFQRIFYLVFYCSVENALRRVDAAFELFTKLGVCFFFSRLSTLLLFVQKLVTSIRAGTNHHFPQTNKNCDAQVEYYTFHDRDIAPEGKTLEETNKILDTVWVVSANVDENSRSNFSNIFLFIKVTDYMLKKQKETGVKLLWGTANLFSNPRFASATTAFRCASVNTHFPGIRYMNGGGTNPQADAFAYAAAQVKKAMELTLKLGGVNYGKFYLIFLFKTIWQRTPISQGSNIE